MAGLNVRVLSALGALEKPVLEGQAAWSLKEMVEQLQLQDARPVLGLLLKGSQRSIRSGSTTI